MKNANLVAMLDKYHNLQMYVIVYGSAECHIQHSALCPYKT